MSALTVVSSEGESEKEIQADFESFWAIYPRKVAKKAARTAWDRIGPSLYPKIIEAAVSWAKVWKDKEQQFIPHAATWLHGERFEDELPREYKATAQAHKPFSAKPETFVRGELPDHVKQAIRKALDGRG